jgi:antitoxin ParD1/3/4
MSQRARGLPCFRGLAQGGLRQASTVFRGPQPEATRQGLPRLPGRSGTRASHRVLPAPTADKQMSAVKQGPPAAHDCPYLEDHGNDPAPVRDRARDRARRRGGAPQGASRPRVGPSHRSAGGLLALWPAPTVEAKTGSRAWLTLGSGMHAPRTMSVSITPDLAAFARAWVASGRYRSASKVVRATLRLLEGEEHRRWKPGPPYKPRKDCPACPSVLPPTTP